MDELEIAFDTKEKLEYFIKYVPYEYEGDLIKDKTKKYYTFKRQDLVPKQLGTFLLDFLNTKFNSFNDFKNFVLEYMFIPMFLKNHHNISINSMLCDNKFNIILSEEEIDTNLNQMFKLYKDEFIKYQNIYKAIAVFKYFKNYNYWNNKKYETYQNYLGVISTNILDLRINYSTSAFQWLYNYKNITNSFVSKNFYDILYISLKNLLKTSKNIKILKCKHCKKYFIPATNHSTKYCDFLFDNKKSCKEIGSQKAYKKILENDELLQLYRKRYSNLSSQAAHTRPTSKSNQMYKYYKKEGKEIKDNYKKGLISKEEFRKWIESTMLKNNSSST